MPVVSYQARLGAFIHLYLKPIGQANPSFLALWFNEYQEVRVILAGMCLPEQSADPRLSFADNNEQVFGNESISCQLVDYFDMCQSLLIGAYLVLAFHNVNTALAQDSPRLTRGGKVQVQYRFVVFLV